MAWSEGPILEPEEAPPPAEEEALERLLPEEERHTARGGGSWGQRRVGKAALAVGVVGLAGLLVTSGGKVWSAHLATRPASAAVRGHTMQAWQAGCADNGEDCTEAKCCNNPSSKCYKKNEWWSSCNESCSPDWLWDEWRWVQKNETIWNCTVLSKDGDDEATPAEDEAVLGPKPKPAPAEEGDDAPKPEAPAADAGGGEGEEPEACCKAMTADCLACAKGMSKDEYCKATPKEKGCPDEADPQSKAVVAEASSEEPESRMCCQAMTADCLACAKGVSEDDYCAANPKTQGCSEALAPDVAAAAGPDEASGEPNVLDKPPAGAGGRMCCMAMTADCLSCKDGVSKDDFCKGSPTTAGCAEATEGGDTGDTVVEVAAGTAEAAKEGAAAEAAGAADSAASALVPSSPDEAPASPEEKANLAEEAGKASAEVLKAADTAEAQAATLEKATQKIEEGAATAPGVAAPDAAAAQPASGAGSVGVVMT